MSTITDKRWEVVDKNGQRHGGVEDSASSKSHGNYDPEALFDDAEGGLAPDADLLCDVVLNGADPDGRLDSSRWRYVNGKLYSVLTPALVKAFFGIENPSTSRKADRSAK